MRSAFFALPLFFFRLPSGGAVRGGAAMISILDGMGNGSILSGSRGSRACQREPASCLGREGVFV